MVLMDNSFEQEFINNVETAAKTEKGVTEGGTVVESAANNVAGAKPGSTKTLKIFVVILAVLVVVEALMIGFMALNYPKQTQDSESIVEEEEEEETVDGDEESDEGETVSGPEYVLDDDNNLVAFNLVCTGENGDVWTFKGDNSYSYDGVSNEIENGTYTVLRDSIISLAGDQGSRVLYYDGFVVADGTTIYDCE